MSHQTQAAAAKTSKRTLAEVVTGLLRDRILDGEFPPGTQMNEVELAAYFEVSRGPLREAMQRLVQEGLLVSYPRRGIFVPALTSEDLEDIFVARQAIEREALRRVTARGVSAGLVADLEVIVARMKDAAARADKSALAALDLAFHRRLVGAAGSTRLDRLYGLIANEMRLCFRMIVDSYSDRSDLSAEHEQLLHVIASGDKSAARTLLDHHFGDPGDLQAAASGQPLKHGLHPHPHHHYGPSAHDQIVHDHADSYRHGNHGEGHQAPPHPREQP
ncbi:GntR family transcriptional regulator [Micromonospora sp. NPDC050200]|uniref:GntR family transcriptional regulator n=1 Tax=Micromonospora sp. NPDC050200 TaxID=3155664 RepID=UPI003401F92F